MVTPLLTDADAREVESAIARVEQLTSAELVVAVLPRSADHVPGRALASVCWALAAALAALRYSPHVAPLVLLSVQLGMGALTFWVSGWAPLQRWLILPRAAERAARARAFQLFAERGLYGTKGQSALLIFVSELERRVVLLGDRTIHAELGQAGWEREVARLLERIRERRLKEGLLEVLAELAPRLSAVAPKTADDLNELPDTLIRN